MTRGSDNPAGFLIFVLGTLAAINIAALWSAFRVVRRTRLLENTPTSKIRSAPQGYVELVGTAQWLPDRHTKSPLSGTECIWRSFTVEKRAHDLRGRATWKIVDQCSSNERFALFDETDSCTVDPRGAKLIGADLKAGGDLRQCAERHNSRAGAVGPSCFPRACSTNSPTDRAPSPFSCWSARRSAACRWSGRSRSCSAERPFHRFCSDCSRCSAWCCS